MHTLRWILLLTYCAFSVNTIVSQTTPQSDLSPLQEEEILMQLEADSLYGHIWNSSQLRYNQITPSATDTIQLFLISENSPKYTHPVVGKVISKYGRRGKRQHSGIDIKLQRGDTIRCAFDGRVRIAKTFSGYGKMVLVRHNNGLETIYSHLSHISVNENDWIKTGELIGLGGRTGRATTEHLHFETRILGEPFDPAMIIDFESGILKSEIVFYHRKKIATDRSAFSSPTKNTKGPLIASTSESIHKVNKGDTLYAIAKKYGTSIAQLCEWNQITSKHILSIGMLLKVTP